MLIVDHKDTCLAVELLKKLGNSRPLKKQLALMELLLSKVSSLQSIYFNPLLTEREKMCLYWLAMGKTSPEIAELFDVKPSTIEYYRKEIKNKLSCKTIAEAVFKGIRVGYLPSEV